MDGIHSNWDEYEEVAMALELSDPGQPYSCASWGNQFNNSEPLIVNGGSPYYDWWEMFETTYVPAHAFIDHKMRLHYKANTLGSWSANNNIEEMLIDCGECYVDGILMEEFGQQDCCEIFGGTFSDTGDWDEFSCSGSDSNWVRLCGNPDGDGDGFVTDDDNCPNDYNPSQTDSDGDGLGDECDDCSNMTGDPNDDMTIDVLDIVIVVNIILNGGANSPNFTECEITDSDMDGNGTINVLDIIQVINAILGQARFDAVDGMVDVTYDIRGNDLVLNFNSDVSMSGLELAFSSDYLLEIETQDNLYSATALDQDIQRLVTFSMENNAFDNLDIVIKNGSLLDIEDIHMVVSSPVGTQLTTRWNIAEIQTFKLTDLQPNPFNPATQIQYEIYNAGDVQLSVYNVLGQEVASLYRGYKSEGNHSFTWNASHLSSGVYYVSMMMNGHVETMKAMFIK